MSQSDFNIALFYMNCCRKQKRIPLCDISANRIVSRSNAFELSGIFKFFFLYVFCLLVGIIRCQMFYFEVVLSFFRLPAIYFKYVMYFEYDIKYLPYIDIFTYIIINFISLNLFFTFNTCSFFFHNIQGKRSQL